MQSRNTPSLDISATGPWFIGKLIANHFRIIKVLGHGRVGVVYLANDNSTNHIVSIKIPLGKYAVDKIFCEQFVQAGKAWANLIYPHIVRVFDVKDDKNVDNYPAVFMEYVDGVNVGNLIYNKGGLSMLEALDIAIQICWAMEFIHNKGQFHLCLKPSNILLAVNGKAMVTDLGGVGYPNVGNISSETVILSDHRYMSPEQWSGKASKQSDIYAFGITLFEMIFSKHPFALKGQVGFKQPPNVISPSDPKSLKKDIPDCLADLILSCLDEEPTARPSNFTRVADILSKTYGVLKGEPYDLKRVKPSDHEVLCFEKRWLAWRDIQYAANAMAQRDLGKALQLLDKAETAFKEINDKEGLAACQCSMGGMYSLSNKYDEALTFLSKALEAAYEMKIPPLACACLGNIGMIHTDRSDYISAINALKKSLSIAESLGRAFEILSCLNNIGVIHRRQGKYQEAKEMFHKALKIGEASGDQDGTAMTYINLGDVCGDLGMYDEAAELYKRALAIARLLQCKKREASAIYGLAFYHDKRKEYDKAASLYNEAIVITQDIGDRRLEAYCCNNLGCVYRARLDFDTAEILYKKCLQIAQELGERTLIATSYLNLGTDDVLRGKFTQGLSMYEKALSLRQELGEIPGIIECLGCMATVSQMMGNYKAYMEYDRKAKELYRMINPSHFPM
jgi:serine/threonine protein kinase/Tfp pilus assembly protein PilF